MNRAATHTFDLRRIAFQEGVFEKTDANAAADLFDADVALATGELGGLITDLVDALGGLATSEEGQ